MPNSSILIRVPATVGNFGGAADAAALALAAPLNVKATPRLDGHVNIRYFGENGERVPRDRSNLVARAMEAALHLREREFTGADFEIYSSVPVAVGLGSSTAAVLAGLLAADRLYSLELDEKIIFELAAIYESRGDNLRAAWFGGFVAAAEEGGAGCHPRPEGAGYRRTVVPENFVLSVVAPECPLSAARQENAARQTGRSDGALDRHRAAALAEFFARPGSGAADGIEATLPPTCEKNLPGLADALKVSAPGVMSVFVCGSGPTVGILAQGDSEEAVRAVRECFARQGVRSTWGEFPPTNAGARDWNAVTAEIAFLPARARSSSVEKSPLLPV